MKQHTTHWIEFVRRAMAGMCPTWPTRHLLWLAACALSAWPWAAGTPAQAADTLVAAADTAATGFRVAAFKVLPNDVSAFITPVRDLNGDACALVKVIAPPDFAFSSPLGILKRQNEVGEIWLYMPRRTKLLTIKHPQWGVLRDYRFKTPLESRVVYELRIETSPTEPALKLDTVFFTQTVRDTVVARREPRPALSWSKHVLLTASFHDNGPSWGTMFAMLKRHGFFVHAQSDLHRIGAMAATCDKDGFLQGNEEHIRPYYTGETRKANYAITVGLAHRLCRWLNVFYGAGYGRSALAWQLGNSEGGGYALNEGLTCKGMAAEAGLLCTYKRLTLSASALTVAGNQWQACLGVGIRLRNKTQNNHE